MHGLFTYKHWMVCMPAVDYLYIIHRLYVNPYPSWMVCKPFMDCLYIIHGIFVNNPLIIARQTPFVKKRWRRELGPGMTDSLTKGTDY